MNLLSRMGLLVGCLSCAGDPPPTFSEIQDRVLTPSCAFSTCHKGVSAAGGLNLEAPAYEAMVNVASSQNPAKSQVAPGDPAGSYLLDKMVGEDQRTGGALPAGVGMPLTGFPIDAERVALVRAWIEAGALND
jgi:hypothetical protein